MAINNLGDTSPLDKMISARKNVGVVWKPKTLVRNLHHPGLVMLWLRNMTLAIAVTALLPASFGIAQGDGDAGTKQASQFDVVEDRTERLNDAEQQLTMRLLAESRATPLAEKRASAQELLAERRSKMPEFADRSNSAFAIEDILRVSDLYRGRLVEFQGYARSVARLPAFPNDHGIEQLHRISLYVEEGDSSRVEVYFLDLPANWPDSAKVIDDITVVGRFVKLIKSLDQKTGRPILAPMIVAERIEIRPKLQSGNVTIDPALWKGVVRHKQREWTDAERDLYYRVLHHARSVDYKEQEVQAKKNLRSRIDRYRTEAEAERDRLHQRAERYLTEHPKQKAEYEQQIEEANAKLKQKLRMYQRFREDPKLFPTYADIVNNDHLPYNGQLVTLSGRVREIMKSPVDENIRFDLGTLYELWLYTEDSQMHPTVLLCTSLPEGLLEKARTEGERLDEPVSATGYFFKLYVYRAHDTDRFAPMLLSKTINWQPRPVKKEPTSAVYLLPMFGLLVAGMVYFFWRTKREDQRYRQQLAVDDAATTIKLDQIEEAPEEPLKLDQIEASEEPHFRDHGAEGDGTEGDGTPDDSAASSQ